MSRIKGWEKDKYFRATSTEVDRWVSNNNITISIDRTLNGYYTVYIDTRRLLFTDNYGNARKEALEFMRLHSNG